MTKRWWRVTGTVTVSAYTYVEAATKEAAMKAVGGLGAALCPGELSQYGCDSRSEAIIDDADGVFKPTVAEPEDPPDEDDEDGEWLRGHAPDEEVEEDDEEDGDMDDEPEDEL